MQKRKRHAKPTPWLEIERLQSSAKGSARRHYIATAISDVNEYILHARKGWRRYSRKQQAERE